MMKSGKISDKIIDYILKLPEVIKAKEQFDLLKNGSINYNIQQRNKVFVRNNIFRA